MSAAEPQPNEGMPTYGLDVEFPMMWAAAKAVNDAERSGQSSFVGPLHRELENAMHELWMARSNLVGMIVDKVAGA